MSSTTRATPPTTRKKYITSSGGGGAPAAPAVLRSQGSPNERVNVAVIGFHGRGKSHYRAFAKMANVRVAALCDADERLFSEGAGEVEKLAGYRPATEFDFRRLLDNKDIDAISIATPDYWHALMTISACQAGKDVYVEKPVSFTIEEGRKMVDAARKYNRIVQAGQNMRSAADVRAAIRFLHEGKLGSAYRAKAVIFKPRGSIGRVKDSPVPQGVHWDLFLGPSPSRPFNLNRFHYGWHFFWDTSTTDVGNSGVHELDVARWGLNKKVHPVKVHSTGGLYVWDSDQETPNVQTATLEYADGTLLEVELTNLYTPPFDGARGTHNIFYTSQGYVSSASGNPERNATGWRAIAGKLTPRSPGPETPPAGISEATTNASFPQPSYGDGPAINGQPEKTSSHFENFIECVRSRKREELYCDIAEGHMSAALCHLANISFRTGRKLQFDPNTERFVGDEEANRYLRRAYRKPYVLPEKV